MQPGHGRGMACGFWFNIGGESTAQVHINEDGSVTAATGSPDIGGSRASVGMMVAEVLGIPASRVRTVVADTTSIGFTHVTGGSRVTFATGMAATQAAEKVVDELKKRAATIWEIPVEAVDWQDGKALPAGSNAGAFDPLGLAALALKAGRTGGPINAEVSLNAQGAGPGFGVHGMNIVTTRSVKHASLFSTASGISPEQRSLLHCHGRPTGRAERLPEDRLR